LSFLFKLLRSLWLARRIMTDFKPAAVIGTGSYVAFPAVLAARLAGVPAYIHESNAKFGVGNRLAGTFCSQAALGLPIEGNPLAAKSELIGTPVREAFAALPLKEEARSAMGLEAEKFTVLVFGGSQGARRLNSAFISALKSLKGDIQAVHLTGRRNFDAVKAEYARAGLADQPGVKLMDYTEDMPAIYAAADLVVARSGASTVAELAQLAKASILVPLPTSAAGHQEANARALCAAGASVCLEESEDFDAGLIAALRAFLEEPGKAAALSENLKKAGIPPGLKAAAAFADLIEGKETRRY
jgi:UDP-N-acetylglucosamine--N-acetylmuramyl-(pentapeptide) pyrophosphoryl-undecaprenol N-acetylglucosamine transferase